VEIFKAHVARDHVHRFVSSPPQVTTSRLVQRLKGKSSHYLLAEFAHLRRAFWGSHLWARGYLCCNSGNVTDDFIAAYIESQAHDEDVDFRVEGEAAQEGGAPKPPASGEGALTSNS
jgi:putative transposase